jgi:hypothetical protein
VGAKQAFREISKTEKEVVHRGRETKPGSTPGIA